MHCVVILAQCINLDIMYESYLVAGFCDIFDSLVATHSRFVEAFLEKSDGMGFQNI